MAERNSVLTQDRKFGEEITDHILCAVANCVDPDQVYDMDALIDCVKKNSTPEDVFGNAELESWASENGWVKQ